MITLQTLAIWAPIVAFILIMAFATIVRQAINREQQRERKAEKATWGSN